MKSRQHKGFTLVELVVVIAIIGVLAAILIPTMMNYVKKAKLKQANANAKLIFNTVTSEAAIIMADGDSVDSDDSLAAGSGIKIDSNMTSSLTGTQKRLAEAIYKAFKNNGADSGYCLYVFGADGKLNFSQWSSQQSGAILGQYPDPCSDPDDAVKDFSSTPYGVSDWN